MLIDDFMPVYDFSEKHETVVRASAENIFGVIDTVDFSESFVIRWLLRLRGMSGEEVSLRSMKRSKFKILAERQNEEILIGLAGQFWKPGGNMQDVDAGNFSEFDRPGFAKATWNFAIRKERGVEIPETLATPETSGNTGTQKPVLTHLTTETRIRCTDETSRSRFRFYWTFIRPFSAWIRNEMLFVVKEKAENPPNKDKS